MNFANKLAFVVTPSTEHMTFEERRAGIAQMMDDLAKLATDDGCIAAAWALEVIETIAIRNDELEDAEIKRSRQIPISQMELHDRTLIERQRHANEVHELKQVNNDLQQAVAFLDRKLRDQFAMAAIAGIIPTDAEEMAYEPMRRTAAELAYQVADAMIDEREKALRVKNS